jgi:uncharacterized protein YbjT (DUF2867 family)
VQREDAVGPVLVFGATGTHGGAVARELLARAIAVRAFVRDPQSPRARALSESGVGLLVGDLDDQSSIARALAGSPIAYAVTTPFERGAQEEVRQGEAIVGAAIEAQLPWLIYASVAAAARANVPHFQSKAQIEERLRDSPLAWTVLAPSYFYENVLGSGEEIRQGRLSMPMPANKPLHQVALGDLGALVAAVLGRREEHLCARVEVAGDAPTPSAMAHALGVAFHETPLAEVGERSSDLAAMYSFLSSEGYGIDVSALRARYPEVPWRRFSEWAAALDWSSPGASS